MKTNHCVWPADSAPAMGAGSQTCNMSQFPVRPFVGQAPTRSLTNKPQQSKLLLKAIEVVSFAKAILSWCEPLYVLLGDHGFHRHLKGLCCEFWRLCSSADFDVNHKLGNLKNPFSGCVPARVVSLYVKFKTKGRNFENSTLFRIHLVWPCMKMIISRCVRLQYLLF